MTAPVRRPRLRPGPTVVVAICLTLTSCSVYWLGWLSANLTIPHAGPDQQPVATPTVAAPPDAGPVPHQAVPPRAPRPAVSRPLTAIDRHGPYGAWRSTGTRTVALTFDDGPDPRWTPEVLSLLRRHRIQATFCVLGNLAARYPHLIRAIAADRHTLCNHSWKHDMFLGQLPSAVIRADLTRTNDAIRRAAPGAGVRYFRQPGGNWQPRAIAVARQLGMTPLHWSVDPQDWRKPGARTIVSTVRRTTRPGSIILLHDAGGARLATLTALRTLLPWLERRYHLTALPSQVP